MFDKLMKGFGLEDEEQKIDSRKNYNFEAQCMFCLRGLEKEESITNCSGDKCRACYTTVEKAAILPLERISEKVCTNTLVDGQIVFRHFKRQITEAKSTLKYKTYTKTYDSLKHYYQEKQIERLQEDKDYIFKCLQDLVLASKNTDLVSVKKRCVFEVAKIINELATKDLTYHDEIIKDKRIEQAISTFQEIYPKLLKYKYKHVSLFSLGDK